MLQCGGALAVVRPSWLRGHRAPRMRRCSECGYSWAMPQKERRVGHGGIELTPHLQSAALMIGDQITRSVEEDVEVREALSHCPQCGSGHFTEYRADTGSKDGAAD